MAKFTTTLLCATALIAVAGCAKKRPETLPPAPVDSSAGVDPTGGLANGGANGAIVPGSDADFRRSVQSNTVNFALDMYDIDPTARAILDSQAEWLARNPNVRITIEGHCDERGTRRVGVADDDDQLWVGAAGGAGVGRCGLGGESPGGYDRAELRVGGGLVRSLAPSFVIPAEAGIQTD